MTQTYFLIGNVIQAQVMEYQCTNGLKGQQALSPGQRPGYQQTPTFALKGQKPYESDMLLPFQGEGVITVLTQGDALGYGLITPSGRAQRNLNNVMMTFVRAYNGFLTTTVLTDYCFGLGGVVIGTTLGAYVFKRIPNRIFRYIVYAYIAVSGVIILL